MFLTYKQHRSRKYSSFKRNCSSPHPSSKHTILKMPFKNDFHVSSKFHHQHIKQSLILQVKGLFALELIKMVYLLKIQPFLYLAQNDIVVFRSSRKWRVFLLWLIILEVFGNCKKLFLHRVQLVSRGEATTCSIITSVLSTVKLSKYPKCH